MAKQKLIGGCKVLEEGRSADRRFPSVVVCELPEPEGGFEEDANRYVVWYVDQQGTPNIGSYQKTLDAAGAIFDGRT